jgi:Uma2 family endonuclease
MPAGFSPFDAWVPAPFVPRLLTVEDCGFLPDELPSGPVRFELDNGRLVADRLLTVDDLEGLPTELPTGPVDYELDNGRLVPMTPPGNIHGAVQLNIAAVLKGFADRTNLGRARTEASVLLWRNPDRLAIPDALFVSAKSLPIRETREGYLETIPELVVEVRSKNDGASMVANKVADYLKAGVQVVWVADPADRTVTVHRSDREPQVLRGSDAITCEGILPGFRLALADVFAL